MGSTDPEGFQIEMDPLSILGGVDATPPFRYNGVPLPPQEETVNRIALAFLLFASPAFATDPRFLASLNRLDPATKLEQVCDLEAMGRIGQADRAKSDVISHPVHNGNVLTANGGALRMKGKWYRLSFVCKATADHLAVVAFTYKVGELIPAEKWPEYGLWR
jgi:uncharacterized protein DUF930